MGNLIMIIAVLGVAGLTGSRRWAANRRGRSRIGTGTRLAWLALPIGGVTAVPTAVGALFGGRDVTWLTAWYGWCSLITLFAVIVAGCLATAAAQTVSLLHG